ncbi:MAG: hypothetical protein H6Q15_465 [Bacteroidetes bacterium]|nr:hypothetical protein [Bacteroidota bacterium]
MPYYSYKLEHDFGLAPNPFGRYCTLAVCKSHIRNNKKLNIGDWVIGTGSKGLGCLHHLIFAMKVEEKINFNQYWEDERFQYKKPVLNGSLVQMYGDNFYHLDHVSKKWIQENSAHSMEDGTPNIGHSNRDTGGEFVLISEKFYYFGDDCRRIPNEYLDVCCEGRDMKSSSISNELGDRFIEWLESNHRQGIHGDPINWGDYQLEKIEYEVEI